MSTSRSQRHDLSFPSTASALRPRTSRLISGLDDGDPIMGSSSTPIPTPASRPVPIGNASTYIGSAPSRFEAELPDSRSSDQLHPLHGAWNQFQGFASSLWTGEPTRTRNKLKTAQSPRSKPRSAAGSATWGPTGQTQDYNAARYDTDRASLVRDAKRKLLLSADVTSNYDASRHKRKNSDDSPIRSSAIPTEAADTDALLYVHTVRPEDTLAGLSLKYNCPAAVLRKANRMWPNDPIQSRKIILVPVDASSTKGQPSTESVENTESSFLENDIITKAQHPHIPKISSNPLLVSRKYSPDFPKTRPLSRAVAHADPEVPWRHDCWVMLPRDNEPTQVVRLARHNLGYFPRARRKSASFSDTATSGATSLDLGSRSSLPKSPASRQPNSVSGYDSPPTRLNLTGRPSFTGILTHPSSNTMANLLQGPGGVGSLGKGSTAIGPGVERLTELLGSHLPNVAPPPSQTVYTPWAPSLLEDDEKFSRLGMNGNLNQAFTPSSMDLQDIGGAVEGWVRKMTKKAASALEANATTSNTHSRANPAMQELGLGAGSGDLIELVDAFEIGHDPLTRSDSYPASLPVGPSNISSSILSTGSSSTGRIRGRKPMRHDSNLETGQGD